MEACLSAHFVSRTLRGLGFEPRIIPAKPSHSSRARRTITMTPRRLPKPHSART
jgi:transposase